MATKPIIAIAALIIGALALSGCAATQLVVLAAKKYVHPEDAAARAVQRRGQEGSCDGRRRAMLRSRALEVVKSHATIEIVELGPESTENAEANPESTTEKS